LSARQHKEIRDAPPPTRSRFGSHRWSRHGGSRGRRAAGLSGRPAIVDRNRIVGETIHYPTTGPAHVTAAIVTLAPGEKTSVHKHGVPLFAYILEGELTVDYAGYSKRTYRAGEAFMEAMDVAHFGINTGAQTMRLLAVYMGAQGSEDVIPVK
jgi:quercetin dioxygenase-like cupin family protein